jgi:desulfoferrodoxin-like iron-binding protein
MAQTGEVYKCKNCGCEVAVKMSGHGTLKCCGIEMEKEGGEEEA